LAQSTKLFAFACACVLAISSAVPFGASSLAAQDEYDVVLAGGRVIDPESGLDQVRNLGISGGKIRAISERPLKGRTSFNCAGLVLAPGFIDLHAHGVNEENNRFQAMDGVTTALELEGGSADIDQWYSAREGKSLINYGVSAGHGAVRMKVMRADAVSKEANDEQIAEMRREIGRGLERGAVAVGFGIQYTPGASRWEIQEMFRAAAAAGASCHPHIRHAGTKEPESSITALEEVIAAAAITGAPLHVVHITSSGIGNTPRLLQMIKEARSRGLDVTTECYPYTAAMTNLQSAIFDEGWQQKLDIDYKDLQWVATGERLTAETFAEYRKAGGMVVIHLIPESMVRMAVADPTVMIASDGLIVNGKGHPRGSGSYARVLGRYVREQRAVSLMDALRKMSLMPAKRLERRAPQMKDKGRIRVGADADIVVFDPLTVSDTSSYEEPAKYSVGMKYVLVNGVFVVKDGALQSEVAPGRAVRAPIKQQSN
jgi:dihydroorotase